MALYTTRSPLPINKKSKRLRSLTLYSDQLTEGGSYQYRQLFSYGSSAVTYGGGSISIPIAGSSGNILTHFDCLYEQYPAYDNGLSYGAGGQTVYAGYYGNALFQKTGLGAGGGSGGWAPLFTSPSGSQDAHGWTRYRPASRTLATGKTLSISFILLLGAGGTMGGTNQVRVGLYQSTGNYINYDNYGLQNPLFSGYSGYMVTYGFQNHKILKRTDASSQLLMNSIVPTGGTAIYTDLVNSSMSGFNNTITSANVLITVKSLGGSVLITSTISNPSLGGNTTIQYTDASPVVSFDTLAVHAASPSVTSIGISNPLITYS